MIKWCAYCQKYLGQFDPIYDYTFNHGICSPCSKKTREVHKISTKNLKPIVDFYRSIQEKILKTETISVEEVIKTSKNLDITPIDFTLGFLQPLLWEIGRKYVIGEVNIVQEHLFSQFVEKYLLHIDTFTFENIHRSDILLVSIEGNFHSYGLRILHLNLIHQGMSSYIVTPGLPGSSIISLIKQKRPKLVGISVGAELKENKDKLKSFLEKFRTEIPVEDRPRIVLGGQGANPSLQMHGIDFIHNANSGIETFVEFIKKNLEKKAA